VPGPRFDHIGKYLPQLRSDRDQVRHAKIGRMIDINAGRGSCRRGHVLSATDQGWS
jgi:hypothetical protein